MQDHQEVKRYQDSTKKHRDSVKVYYLRFLLSIMSITKQPTESIDSIKIDTLRIVIIGTLPSQQLRQQEKMHRDIPLSPI